MAKAKKKSKSKREKLMAGLIEISRGVMVNKNYKPGNDPALDAVLKKLAQDPSSLDSSGMGTSFNVNQMK